MKDKGLHPELPVNSTGFINQVTIPDNLDINVTRIRVIEFMYFEEYFRFQGNYFETTTIDSISKSVLWVLN